MFVIPKSGMQIPDMVQRDFLPPEGREVVPNGYWFRRLRDGDVTEGTAPSQPAASSATAAAVTGSSK